MSLRDVIILASYVGVALLSWRYLAGAIAWHENEKSSFKEMPDGDEWVAGIIAGVLLAAVWPAVGVALVLYRLRGVFMVLPLKSRIERRGWERVRTNERTRREMETARRARELGVGGLPDRWSRSS